MSEANPVVRESIGSATNFHINTFGSKKDPFEYVQNTNENNLSPKQSHQRTSTQGVLLNSHISNLKAMRDK